MRYNSIDQNLFIKNRANFLKLLPKDTICVFNSNDIMPTNSDGEMGFKQNSDLFYLTGIDQEETTLVIDKNNENDPFHLFIKETSDLIKIWEGEKLTKDAAKKVSGIEQVLWNNDLNDFLNKIIKPDSTYYYNSNEHGRAASKVETRDDRFTKKILANHKVISKKVAPIMHQLRQVKSENEIALINNACNITKKGFERVLKFTKPGVYEYEIEAEITHEFLINKSRGHAYAPIIASGNSACILHYTQNNNIVKNGDLILMDFGAEYANYASDLTRTIPANGKYSNRQKNVYNAVLRTMNFAKTQLTPGNTIKQYQKDVCLFIEKELINLKLLSISDIKKQDPKNPAYKKYFMHGVSHSLGLDVHDVDNRDRPLENGMVYTIEPGIYIQEEGIGVRIENNFVIDNEAPIDLMESIPIEVEEIENLMND